MRTLQPEQSGETTEAAKKIITLQVHLNSTLGWYCEGAQGIIAYGQTPEEAQENARAQLLKSAQGTQIEVVFKPMAGGLDHIAAQQKRGARVFMTQHD